MFVIVVGGVFATAVFSAVLQYRGVFSFLDVFHCGFAVLAVVRTSAVATIGIAVVSLL